MWGTGGRQLNTVNCDGGGGGSWGGGGGGPFEMAMGMAQPLNYRDDFSQVLRASIHGP